MSANSDKSAQSGPTAVESTENADEKMMPRRTFIKGAGAAGAAIAVGTGTAVADDGDGDWHNDKGGLNFGSEYVPGPYFREDGLTKAKHKLTWGTDDAALVAYEDDAGEKATLSGVVDREDTENVVTLRADKVEAPDFYQFPRGEQYDEDGDGDAETDVLALDPSHWSTTDATNGTISVQEGDGPVSHSLRVSTSSVAAGETVSAEFTDASVTSDPQKRYLQGVVNVDELTSGAVVTLAFVDEDGDRKELTIDPSGDASTAGVIASSTGKGIVFQARAGDLPTVANGDGDWSGTETVRVEVAEANADVTFTGINAEKMSEWGFGSYLTNEDTDDEERTDRTTPSGSFTVTGLDTLGSALTHDDAVVYDVSLPVKYPLAETTEAVRYKFEAAGDYPGYDFLLTVEADQVIEDAYDLSHNGPVYAEKVEMPPDRYTNVETATGVGSTDFGDVGDDSWSSHTTAFDAQGSVVQFSDAVVPGEVSRSRHTVKLTSSNRDSAEQSGGGGPVTTNNGGSSGILGWVVALATGVLGFLGLRSRGE